MLVRGVVFLSPAARRSRRERAAERFLAFGRRGCSASTIWSGCLRFCSSPCRRCCSHPTAGASTPPAATSEAAYLSGVAVDRVIASTYVWCGGLAGVAGVMLAARLQSGQPTAGEFYELTAIAAVVLGGASLHGGEGTLYKSVIGVFIMIVLGNSLNLLNVDSYWQRVAVGASSLPPPPQIGYAPRLSEEKGFASC